MSAQLFARRAVLASAVLFAAFVAIRTTASIAQPAAGPTSPIGKVESVTGSATVEHTGDIIVQASLAPGEVAAKSGDAVYLGDIVKTGLDSKIALVFTDGTSFKIDSNARMELNEFVYDPKSKSNSTLFNLQKGSFTFLAGSVAKTGNMRVETPVGTMGIRGTAPHVEILEDGTVKFTTLVEENKKNEQTKVAPAPQRKADNASSGRPQVAPKDEALAKKIDICRGC